MRLSNTRFDRNHRYWQDYLPYLQSLAGPGFPDCDQLNLLLNDDLSSAGGHTIRFVPSAELDDDTAYERRIHNNGQVSTRPGNWHDLFNALVWMRFPRIKAAMNSLHNKVCSDASVGTRGVQRDALTLFDESGVIVFSQHGEPLDALLRRNWSEAFQTKTFHHQVHHVISGHAILEKYLAPYKSMTAKALLVKVNANVISLPREKLLMLLDEQLADLMLAGKILTNPACLTPLPLAGIPGWWPGHEQDDGFYADQQVFRPPPVQMTSATLIIL